MTTRTERTDEFMELVCADPDLLRAEFDALMSAAGFPPDERPEEPAPATGRGGREAKVLRPDAPQPQASRRQRSPPC